MSTKALRKELFAAVAMLIVAAIALSGSTYAWFAANTTVEARDMHVTVESDMTFLIINEGHETSAAAIQATPSTWASASAIDAQLKPVSITGDAITNIATIEDNGTWYYEYSSDPSLAVHNDTGYTELTFAEASTPGAYVLVNEFSLTVAKGSNPVNNLKVSTCSITAEDGASTGAVKVIVATSENCETFSAAESSGSTTLAAVVNDQTAVNVKIYIYWDGVETPVFTNNIANLKGTSVVVSFTGDVGSRT